MAVFGPCLEDTDTMNLAGSLTDLRAKLIAQAPEQGRMFMQTEEKYDPRVLIGNWFERRVSYVPPVDEWKTLYQQDFITYNVDRRKENKIALWNTKLENEGLTRSILLDHHGDTYYDNMSTVNDLIYRVLPKDLNGPKLRTYNARKKTWIPEQELTVNYGNITQFGLKEGLQTLWDRDSDEAVRYCRWRSTYADEHNVYRMPYLDKRYHRKRTDWNEPRLEHLRIDLNKCPSRCPIAFRIRDPNTYMK